MDDALVAKVAELTGLQSQKVESILKKWVQETGRSPQGLGLEDLREVLVTVLQDLFVEVAAGENEFINLSGSGAQQ